MPTRVEGPLQILIAGAGIGGVTAALSLMKAGHDAVVFEQADQLSEIGAGIQLSANAMHVLNNLGLGEEISRLSFRPRAYVFRLHDTGEIVSQFPLADVHQSRHGASYNQLHRADLHNLLVGAAQALKPDLIRLGRRATRFEETPEQVSLQFADGSTAKGHVLVGADGIKSVVREQIAGPDRAVYTGDAAWRLVIPTARLPSDIMPPVMSVWMGSGRHAVCYYLRGGELLNFAASVETNEVSEESWTATYPWRKLKDDFIGWHKDIQTIIDAAPGDKCFRWSLFCRPPISKWSTQRTTLLGDSAHATLPYLAQGAAMAIEDGAVLARALGIAADVPEALQMYERNRIKRTTRIVEGSSANRALFHMREQAALRAAFANRDEGASRSEWLYSYNPLTVALE